ncbi:copper-binding protein [Cenarchaeum symbiosum A]|uniref:Copper-binding protein n=1 Tax=Cenarchaeum symbiosum (strain A) TaxID=414004 RepID=A0RWE5_CENSY|nr:copper-binding protein [Cenarchaeum symbiosum A]
MPVPVPEPAGPAVLDYTTISILEGSDLPCETCFDDASIVVGRNSLITWSDDDDTMHSLASGTVEGGPDGVFESGLLHPGHLFHVNTGGLDAGIHDYHCVLHPWMTGSIEVREQ